MGTGYPVAAQWLYLQGIVVLRCGAAPSLTVGAHQEGEVMGGGVRDVIRRGEVGDDDGDDAAGERRRQRGERQQRVPRGVEVPLLGHQTPAWPDGHRTGVANRNSSRTAREKGAGRAGLEPKETTKNLRFSSAKKRRTPKKRHPENVSKEFQTIENKKKSGVKLFPGQEFLGQGTQGTGISTGGD